MHKIGFDLNRGHMTSALPKIKINPQKFLPCKIWHESVHWGPFYGTPMEKFAHFAVPLLQIFFQKFCNFFSKYFLKIPQSLFLIAHSLLHTPCSLLLAPCSLLLTLYSWTFYSSQNPLSWSLTLEQLQLVWILFLWIQNFNTKIGENTICFLKCRPAKKT